MHPTVVKNFLWVQYLSSICRSSLFFIFHFFFSCLERMYLIMFESAISFETFSSFREIYDLHGCIQSIKFMIFLNSLTSGNLIIFFLGYAQFQDFCVDDMVLT